MVKSVNFAVRNSMGGVTRGLVAGDGASDFIQVGSGDEISLNLRKTNILKYTRDGEDLLITLVDGRTITLSGFFEANAQLYVSADGELTAVSLDEGGDGVIYAGYGRAEVIGKWSPNDQLAFLDGDDIIGPATDDDTTGMAMFAPLAGLGAAGAAGAGLIGLGLLNPGDDPTNPGTNQTIIPTVDDPDSENTLTSNSTDKSATVSGTGEEGSTVEVTVGNQTLTTVIDSTGLWSVTFKDTTLPSDGDYEAVVKVTAPDGTVYSGLDGPGFLIDMTPPDVAITAGAQSTGDVENYVEYQDGITISGTGEIGATISVTIDGYAHTTTVVDNGSGTGIWEVTFSTTELSDGEYTKNMVVTATDALGNVTTLNDVLVVDTEASVAFSNASVTTDNVVNASEATNGFTLTGTSEAGTKSVTVTLDGNSYVATVDASGNWSATLSGVALGTGDRTATVTAIDAYDNVSATVSKVITFDTEASVAFSNASVTSDNVVNKAEAASGFVLSGTAEVGSTSVVVTLNGVDYPATINSATGDWSVTVYGAGLSTGTHTATVVATDAYGNASATVSKDIAFDVEAALAFDATQSGSDNLISGVERTAAGGVLITGTADAGATVTVSFADGEHTVTADAVTGAWVATFSSSEIPPGTYTLTATATSTDGALNTATAIHAISVDTMASVAFNAAYAGDNVVSGSEAANGFVISGTSDPGTTSITLNLGNGQVLTIDNQDVFAIDGSSIDAYGNWQATITGMSGDGYHTVTATATDGNGNTSATVSKSLYFDTSTWTAFDATQAGDNVISGTERTAAGGVNLTGTAEAGASVTVALNANGTILTHTVQANAVTGVWTANFTQAELATIPTGTYTATATARATDAYGNVSTVAYDTVLVDTEVNPLTITTNTPNTIKADGVVNAAEGASGVVVTGTVEAGATSVLVQLQGYTTPISATVNAATGTWTATIPSGSLPSQEVSNVALTVTATDAYGNTSSKSTSVDFDPLVRNFTVSSTVASDNIVNAQEAEDGFQISGTVEAGSTVVVTLINPATGAVLATQQTTAGTSENWSVTFDETALAGTSGTISYSVTAYDVAGNEATMPGGTGSFTYDLTPPESPNVDAVMFRTSDNAMIGVLADVGENTYDLSAVSETGTVSALNASASGSYYQFSSTPVPDGSYLVVTDHDTAGNTTSTLLLATNDASNTTTVTVDLSRAGLSDFDFGTIDLTAAKTELTITDTQIEAITGAGNDLYIKGDSGDHVTLQNATDTHQNTTVDGHTYSLYTLGVDGERLWVDDAITNLTI